MPSIDYAGNLYSLQEDESVLDALLRNGVKAPHSCKAGSCGSCLMRVAEGTVPGRAQTGLKESWKAQGYFLACVCRPETDLAITTVGVDAQLGATITALELLSHDVLRVRLHCDTSLGFRPGQYVTILRDGGLARSYSIASLPEESDLELHVRRITGGKMSGWFHDIAQIGERVSIVGPSGECFYVPGKEDQPMLLVGTGTGLAPLYGIIRDASASRSSGTDPPVSRRTTKGWPLSRRRITTACCLSRPCRLHAGGAQRRRVRRFSCRSN